jgi:hypothetical protein
MKPGKELVLALALGAALGGCGQSRMTPQPSAAVPASATPAPAPAPVVHRRATPAKSQATAARVDAASDAIVVEGQASVSAGAPSDAQVAQELKQAEQAGVQLPSGNTTASFLSSIANANVSAAQAQAAGASIPLTTWNRLHKPIADWIVPVLQWAYQHGWTGYVTSGYRTYAEQAALNSAGLFSAPAGSSNHESTAYPGGAVDVTNPSQLIQVLAGYQGPEKLIGGVLGPADPEHFSATGF